MTAVMLRSAEDLAAAGLIGPAHMPAAKAVGARYAIAVTPEMAALIDPADVADPIAKQFLPDRRELEVAPEERFDPIGDAAHSPCEGVVHRYPDRVLLKLLQVCAVYCRFCFRRETVGPGQANALSSAALDAAMAYIAARPEIWEVILTGGDPFAASPRRLADVAARLAAIDHVRILRVHTRVPVVDPGRITSALVEALKGSGKTVYVAIHANHPREFTAATRDACARLSDAGFVLVSQSVLLKGVNDDVATLAALMRGFVELRIKPYYLHHPDLARGTAHFRVSIAKGQALMQALRGTLSGLCQPTYVLDIPGGYGKAPLGPDAWDGESITDFRGGAHAYPPVQD
ncbi:lysine-2,3-aminomutase-like protein [Beijerinckia sp. L45]|uniref:lysine-2,3-aminomutase-like protein n=1 Tax=Beijerinckia sp. L45 TaxID=1641855 RepID=UPI00131D087D|nr:lysine-2,3-aminomutase-like protein [Beijerinckia sp. L45]